MKKWTRWLGCMFVVFSLITVLCPASAWSALSPGAEATVYESAQLKFPFFFCPDRDRDGYSSSGGWLCGSRDCNDYEATVNPGASESCGDSIDNDCDGQTDEGCIAIEPCSDNDGDGYSQGGGKCGEVDCDDDSSAVNPGAEEVCNDDIDNNCDGVVDEHCGSSIETCMDSDGDGYYRKGNDCGNVEEDCNDFDATVFPDAHEYCNGKDDDCDGQIDNDCGRDWIITMVDSRDNTGFYNSIALDSMNRPHISYCYIWDSNLKYAYFDGNSWKKETLLESDYNGGYGYGAGFDTSIAVDVNDRPHIVHRRDPYSSSSPKTVEYLYYDGADWLVQDTGGRGVGTDIALDSTGRPHISFYAANTVRYGSFDGSSWEIDTAADEKAEQSTLSSIALDSNNLPHILYQLNDFGYDYTYNILKYVYYSGSSWRKKTVTEHMEGFLESYISLVIDSNDQPHIVYVDSGDDSTEYDDNVLKYAYMENGAWQTEVVFSGKVDTFLSLALDSNDLPHIVFVYRDTEPYEVNDNDLKYAHFDGSSWQFETVAANVGKSYNSIAVDSNDNVCISFCTYKYSGGPATQVDLKVAYLCSDEDGDGYSPEGGACGLEDCDDSIAFLNPGQDELCSDGLDNNCNGRIDEDCSSPIEMQCIDGDGDGYYLNALGCGERDCDDEAAAAYPGAQEICDDDLDNDCDGDVDNYDDDCRSDCSYLDSACVTGAYNTDIKKCVREYASAGTACGDGLECDGSGTCEAAAAEEGAVSVSDFYGVSSFFTTTEITVTWITTKETNIESFNLYRMGPYFVKSLLLNRTPIQAQGVSSKSGTTYTYRDTRLQSRTTYNYKLEAIDSSGNAIEAGQMSAKTGGSFPVFPW